MVLCTGIDIAGAGAPRFVAQRGDSLHHVSAQFVLRGSHDFRVAFGGSTRGAKLIVSRRHEAAIYAARDARVTRSVIRARFGGVGEVSVAFRPARLPSAGASRACHARGGRRVERGEFVGSVRFRGEGSYTWLHVSHAYGILLVPSGTECPSASARVATSPADASRVPAISAFGAGGGRLLWFAAGADALDRARSYERFGVPLHLDRLRGPGIPYSAIAIEHEGSVQVTRLAASWGPMTGLHSEDPALRLTLRPSLPFTGVGRLRICPRVRLLKLRGTLHVSFPGRRNIALTGPKFFLGAHRPGGLCR